MRPIEAIVLGIVQGVSEFLPVSSSAHLILTSRYLGWSDQGLAFDMAVHAGSVLAVLVYARREVAGWLRSSMHSLLAVVGRTAAVASNASDAASQRLLKAVVIGTVPVALAGWQFRDLIANAAREPLVIAVTSIVFGILLGWSDRVGSGQAGLASVGVRAGLLIGLSQALALVPGTSRAGITLTTGLLLGLSRDAAVRFSFLLAIPVGLLVAGKRLTELVESSFASVDVGVLALGFFASAISAYAAIVWLVVWVQKQNLDLFVVYRIVLGLGIIISVLL